LKHFYPLIFYVFKLLYINVTGSVCANLENLSILNIRFGARAVLGNDNGNTQMMRHNAMQTLHFVSSFCFLFESIFNRKETKNMTFLA
jgi:hypothetical protein